jgi:hypothetical protein
MNKFFFFSRSISDQRICADINSFLHSISFLLFDPQNGLFPAICLLFAASFSAQNSALWGDLLMLAGIYVLIYTCKKKKK